MTDSRPPGTLTPGAVLALIGVTAGLAVVVFVTGSWTGTYYSDSRIVSIVVAAIGGLAWLALALARPGFRPASRLSGAFAAALLAFGLSALLAPNQRLALDFLGYALLLTPLYFLLVRVFAVPSLSARLQVVLAALCAIGGLLFVLVIVQTWVQLWSALGQVVIPPLRLTYAGLWLGTPNAVAAFLVLVACAVVPAMLERGRGGRVGAALLIALVGVDVILSASRGAWLGLALAVLVAALAWLLVAGGWRAIRTGLTPWRRVYTVVAVTGVAAVALVAVLAGPAILARATALNDAGLRSDLLSASVRMFQASPVTGRGPGSWAPGRIAFTDAGELDYYIPHAHNVPAEVLAELGIVGVIAGLVVVALALRLVYRGLRSPDRLVRLSAIAALFASVFIMGQQLVDAWIHQPAIIFAYALPVAILDAMLTPPAAASGVRLPTRASMLTIAMIIGVCVGTGAALAPEPAARRYEQATTAADGGNWALAYERSTEAASADPLVTPYQLLRGVSAATVGEYEQARDAFAIAATDDLPASWLDLAAVQLKLGDPGARASLDRAVRLGRQQPMIAVPAADLYRQLGDDAIARELLAEVFTALPSLASDPLWAEPSWEVTASAAVDEALSRLDPWSAMLLALEAGRPDAAREHALALDPSSRPYAATVIEAWTGDASAFADLHARALADPTDAQAVGLCLRVAEIRDASGTTPGWTCDGGWYFGVYPVGRIGGTGDNSAPLVGPDANPHPLYAYRRPAFRQQLVPWLLQVYTTIA